MGQNKSFKIQITLYKDINNIGADIDGDDNDDDPLVKFILI